MEKQKKNNCHLDNSAEFPKSEQQDEIINVSSNNKISRKYKKDNKDENKLSQEDI